MSIARESELELKLELTHDELQRVRSHPALGGLAVGEPVTRTLRSIYFDTPDHRLRAQGISFRLRIGRRRLAADRQGRHGRRERRLRTPSRRRPPSSGRSRTSRHRQSQDPPQGREGGGTVDPGAGVRDRRAAHDAPAALGRRRARAGARRRRGARRQRRERAVRSRAGAEVGQPASACCRRPPSCSPPSRVRLAESSKAERGYSLALRQDATVTPSSRSAAELPRARRRAHLRRGVRPHRAVGGRPDRRQPARGAGDGGPRRRAPAAHRPAPAAQRAARLPPPARHAGPARAGGPCAQALARTRRRAARRRRADRGDLCAGGRHHAGPIRACRACARRCSRIARARASGCGRRFAGSSGRCCSSIWRCGRAPSRSAEGSPALSRKFARSALKKRWKKVAESGERLDDLTVEQRHEMRKALKTLRYTAEFFACLYPEQRHAPVHQGDPQPAGGVRLSQRRRRRRAAERDLPRGLRRQPRGPARGGLRARLAQRPGRPRLEGRPQGLAEARRAAALLGVKTPLNCVGFCWRACDSVGQPTCLCSEQDRF